MTKKAVVIGSGLVGSLWALLLRRRGHEVDVYEKRSDLRKSSSYSGRSINLILTSRGMNALRLAGLEEAALKLSTPVFGRMMHAKNGEQAFQAYGLEKERNLSISRKDLNLVLLQAAEKAGAKFYFDHSLQDIDLAGKKAIFFNGQTVSYEVLFGTDGANSQVRRQLVEKKPDQFQDRMEWLGADYKELFIPKNESLKPGCLHIWPRGTHMMMALANLDGSWTVTLYLPSQGPGSFERIQTPGEIQSFFESEFPDSLSLMPEYVKDYQSHPQSKLGTVRCSRWTFENSVCLLGDAAHGIVPFFGQGANSGFEDCTEILKLYESHKGNWLKVFADFEEKQKPNGNAIADMAIENWKEMSERVGDPQFLLRKKVEAILEKNYPEIFKSRYGMVTYSLIPYSLVKKAGQLQETMFQRICSGISSPEELNLEKAKAILDEVYVPFLREHHISLQRFEY